MSKRKRTAGSAVIRRILENDLQLSEVEENLALASDDKKLRQQLQAAFDDVAEYDTAAEWEIAVRTCEALAVLGWGSRERVDAVTHYNGDCWDTYFVNATGQRRFRVGHWHKRKAGWVLFNPEYRPSPDGPGVPAKEWMQEAGKKFPIVDRDRLASQRNCLKQMPITMGVSGAASPDTDAVSELRRELSTVLKRHLRPNDYGDALDRLYMTLHCPIPWVASGSPGLKIGAYRSKQKSFSCDLTIGEGFAKKSVEHQKAILCDALLEALSALKAKLAKQKATYDIETLQRDTQSAIEDWCSLTGS
ncbi:MAG: hypothetical protein KDB90_03315 [Planctomycetes bacterium]|nr:hypothetical protein [Planctomycetota bacterium]